MMIKCDIYALKKVVDDMINRHEKRIDAMSNRVAIVETENFIELHQFCEYPECYPRSTSIEKLK